MLGYDAVDRRRYIFRALSFWGFGGYEYDARLARRWNKDPKPTSGWSLYSVLQDDPINNSDWDGDTIKVRWKRGFLGLGGTVDLVYYRGKYYLNGSEYEGKVRGFAKITLNYLEKIRNTQVGRGIIEQLESSKNVFVIREPKMGETSSFTPKFYEKAFGKEILRDVEENVRAGIYPPSVLERTRIRTSGGSGGTIRYYPNGTPLREFGAVGFEVARGIVDLFHELVHAWDADRGELSLRKVRGLELKEWRAVYYENLFRKEMGFPYREYYGKVRVLDDENKPIRIE